MTLVSGVHAVGPADGELLVHTYRAGVAQKAGHDLILEATAWSATIEIGDDGHPVAVALEADPRGLRVREGLHGAKALSDSDRASIRANIASKVLGTEPVVFRSSRVDTVAGKVSASGQLTLRGASRPIALDATLAPGGRMTGMLTLLQTDWGITPYKALMGALRVRDDVEVRFDLRLPDA